MFLQHLQIVRIRLCWPTCVLFVSIEAFCQESDKLENGRLVVVTGAQKAAFGAQFSK
jgi:hypothetical protein